MYLTRIFLLIAVSVWAVQAEPRGAWKSNTEYKYLVESRTLGTLDNEYDLFSHTASVPQSFHYTGVLIRATLSLQLADEETLIGKVENARYAQIHTDLRTKGNDWNEVDIEEPMLQFKPLPISDQSFKVKTENGVVKDLIVNKDTPTWEVNILKSIISQLQVDTLGENAKRMDEDPEDVNTAYATFKVMEDSVGGKCEVMYDLSALDERVLQENPELMPMPKLAETLELPERMNIEIMKTKNYEKCARRSGYHFGLMRNTKWEPGANDNGRLMSKTSTSRIVISGSRKAFAIQSSVTTNKMFVSPRLRDDQLALVQSRVNLTLAAVQPMKEKIQGPSNPQPTGSLVYTYNTPFGTQDKHRNEKDRSEGHPTLEADSSTEEDSRNTASWENDEEYWQPTPNLSDPPEAPLLPRFIGYNGKSVSNKINPVKASRDLVHDIGSAFSESAEVVDKLSLEKFAILTDMLQTMSHKQMADAAAGYNGQDPKTKDSWIVIRDAVGSAGTGPALLMIYQWIQEGKIKDLEAASIMDALPSTVKNPTPEYIEKLFSIVTCPKVQQQPLLKTSAILAFTDVVQRAAVDPEKAHNQFPVHSFGRFVSRNDRTIVDKYIPYLKQKLDEAMEKQESAMSQVYVVALGNLGHPAILPVFEPYLEGRQKATKFMRLLMVSAMSKLVETKPKLARSILYRIYTNTVEAHEVRCMAVYLLMGTNPSLPMLQRMAEFTNHDTSRHVNSAVKSAIEELAEIKAPEYQKLAEKARIARDWLTKKDFDLRYSHMFIMDSRTTDDEDDDYDAASRNFAYSMAMSYIGSDEGFPSAWYQGLAVSVGGLELAPEETVAMVSSVQKYIDAFRGRTPKDTESTRTDEIIKMLGIVKELHMDEPLEGNLLVRDKYKTSFYPFDEARLDQLKEGFTKNIQLLTTMQNVAAAKFNTRETVIGYPTETGLPFNLIIKIPSLRKFSIHMQVADDSVTGNLQLLTARRTEIRAGFVTPFDHQAFIAGVDSEAIFFLPSLEMTLTGNRDHVTSKFDLELKLNSAYGEPPKRQKIFHYDSIPFTSLHDILDETPVSMDKNTYRVDRTPANLIQLDRPGQPIGLYFMGTNPLDRIESFDVHKILLSPWSFLDTGFAQVNIFLNEVAMESTMNIKASTSKTPAHSGAASPKHIEQTFNALRKARTDADARRKTLLENTPKGIKSPVAQAVDLAIELRNKKTGDTSRHIISVGWADSGIDEKSKALLYWRSEMEKKGEQESIEACVDVQAIREPMLSEEQMAVAAITPVTYEHPIKEFTASLHLGPKACMNGMEFGLKGKLGQTEEMKEKVKEMVKECAEKRQKEKEHENEPMSAMEECEKARKVAQEMNVLKLGIKLTEYTEVYALVVDTAVDHLRKMWSLSSKENAFFVMRENDEEMDGDIVVSIEADPDMNLADVIVNTPTGSVTFESVPVDELSMMDDEREATCVIEDRRAMTFDEKIYDLSKIEDCSVVVMTSYPEAGRQLTADEKVSVVKRVSKDERIIEVNLGEHTIHLKSDKQGKRIGILADGKAIRLAPLESHRELNKPHDIEYEIYRFKDGSVGVVSPDIYELQITFDGEKLTIKASDKYRKSVRGLCGNLDDNPDNDLQSPRNCHMRSLEKFAASWALTNEKCEDRLTVALASQAKMATCAKVSIFPPSNMIKAHQTGGAVHGECNGHVTKYVFVGDEICFSNKPVPVCGGGCRPKATRPKKFMMHCMSSSNQAAHDLKSRIDKGARPDLSQKPASRSQTFDVPIGCAA